MTRSRLYAALAVAALLLLGVAWHSQSGANAERSILRDRVAHQSTLLTELNKSLASTAASVQPVLAQMRAIAAVQQQRHDDVTSSSEGLDSTGSVESLIHREQADYHDLADSTSRLLESMRSLTNAAEATGTNDETRSLRSNLDSITTNLLSGENSCATAARMIADNLEMLESSGGYGVNSSSDIQHAYDDCDRSNTAAISVMPSFRDSATRLRGVLAVSLHDTRARYSAVQGPLDSVIAVDALPPQVPAADAGDGQQTADSPSATPTVTEVPQVSSESKQPAESVPETPVTSDSVDRGPLTAGNMLPLLRATSAIRVSTQTDSEGAVAEVSVPDTPARGTASPKRFSSGIMADGRWVGIVPLDSGSTKGVIYTLMWVWTDGQAQFIGEVPAENNGFGRLKMDVEDGEIHLSWPTFAPDDNGCCPSRLRTKLLTLDGSRLRLLSDVTRAANESQ
jgi:uncharacterized coiled-coil protein SlyX